MPGRAGDNRITGEQAALRRVATLVARGTPPEAVFAAVAEEAGWVLGADLATLARFNPDGTATVIASWTGASAAFPVGSLWSIGGRNLLTLVFQAGQAARIDDYAGAAGSAATRRPDAAFHTIRHPARCRHHPAGVNTRGRPPCDRG